MQIGKLWIKHSKNLNFWLYFFLSLFLIFLNFYLDICRVYSSELTFNQRLAYDLCTLGKYEDAKKIAQKCYKLAPRDIKNLLILLKIAIEEGNIIEAKQWYKMCKEINKNHVLLKFYEKIIYILEQKSSIVDMNFTEIELLKEISSLDKSELELRKYFFSPLIISENDQHLEFNLKNNKYNYDTLDIHIIKSLPQFEK